MAWPSRRLRWPFLAVALLAYSLALACHLSDPARPREIEPEAIDSSYRFLMFPRGEVPLYETRRLDPDEVVGTLQRAVGVSQAERAADVVAVNTLVRGQTISSADVMVEQRSFKKLEQIGLADPASVCRGSSSPAGNGLRSIWGACGSARSQRGRHHRQSGFLQERQIWRTGWREPLQRDVDR